MVVMYHNVVCQLPKKGEGGGGVGAWCLQCGQFFTVSEDDNMTAVCKTSSARVPRGGEKTFES